MTVAYLIDPFTQSISEVNYSGDYKEICNHLQCDLFDVVYINRENDCVFINDEGLFKENQTFFKVSGYPEPLAGRGLVLGTTQDGDSCSPMLSIEELRSMVSFPILVAGYI